jgi:type VI protein secretion system component Hcp
MLSVPTHLAIAQQPTDVIAGQPITPAVTVYVEDQFNNIVTDSTLPITVALDNNPGGGTLGGTLTASAQSGVATFGDLWINRSGTGYTLVATAPTDAPQLRPVVGVGFAGMTGGEIEARSFSWSATGSPASFSAFRMAIDPSAAGPGLWFAVANGNTFANAVVHVRTTGTDRSEYLTYTLANVKVTTYQTSSADQTVDNFSLSYTSIREDYRPINPDGTLGSPVTSIWNVQTATGSGPTLDTLVPEDAAPTAGLSFGNASPNLMAVSAFGWNVNHPTSGAPSFGDFQLNVNPHSLEPALFLAVPTGHVYSTVVLHVRQAAGAQLEYLTYTFSNVTLSLFGSSESGGGAPQDVIGLKYTRVREDYRPINPDGSLGSPVTSIWDVSTATGSGPTLDSLVPEDAAPTAGLNFGNASSKLMAVTSFNAAVTHPSSAPIFGDFRLTVSPHSLEPALLLAVANGHVYPTVVLHVHQTDGAQLEYLTYTFSNVTLSSYSTSESGGAVPQDNIGLRYTRIREDYRPINPDGTLGSPITSIWDVATATGSGPNLDTLVPEDAAPTAGLNLGNASSNLLAVNSFGWRASNPGGVPAFNDFQLVVSPHSLEPALLLAVASGHIYPTVVLHVRQADGDQLEYLTYTFSNVTLSAYSTSESAGSIPVDSITLKFTRVREDYRPINPDGTLGTAVTSTWDLPTVTGSGPTLDSLVPEDAAPTVGLSFGNSSANLMAVTGFNWRVARPSGPPTFSDFQLTVNPHSLEPALLLATANGHVYPTVVLHVHQADGAQLEYLTYTFSNVTVSAFSTSESGGGVPLDSITLKYTSVREDYRPINPDGTLGSPVTSMWNVQTATGSGPNLDSLVPEDTAPAAGVSFGNASSNLVAVSGFAWGVSKSSGAPSFNDFQLTINPHSLEPAVFLAVANGHVYATVVLHVFQTTGAQLEYLTYTFSNVTLSLHTTSETGDAVPQDVINLKYTRVREDYRPTNPDGSVGTPVTTIWDVATATGSGGPIVGTPLPNFRVTSSPFTVCPAAAVSFAISAPPTATQGVPFLIQVYALDPFGNIDTNYTGTVTFTSSDAAATLPDNYAFQPGDAGVATFTITLNTLDDQTLTATDIGDNSITGTTAVTVIPPG